MFEGVVATILNRYLGKYIQDLDTENLNVGIFSGEVQLTELRLKPEALVSTFLKIYNMQGTIFWNLTPCTVVQVYLCFAGAYCLHLQSQRVI
jgi:hypothetical protein